MGRGVSFTVDEKNEAQGVGNQFFIQNLGVLGDVSGSAQISNQQSAELIVDLDVWQSATDQIRQALSSLPDNLKSELVPYLDEIEQQLTAASPDKGRLYQLAKAVMRVCEGAAGNLVAAGIGAILGRLI